MITTWVPLTDIPKSLGGLALLPGSHLGPQVGLELLEGPEPGWATTDFHVGDVVAFHCLTAHAAMPNRRDDVRLSGSFRWVLPEEPAAAELIYGAGGSGRELLAHSLAGEPRWRPVPASATAVDGRPRPPGRSRFFPVHPAWEAWSEPSGGLA
jgi:hypothetical protein